MTQQLCNPYHSPTVNWETLRKITSLVSPDDVAYILAVFGDRHKTQDQILSTLFKSLADHLRTAKIDPIYTTENYERALGVLDRLTNGTVGTANLGPDKSRSSRPDQLVTSAAGPVTSPAVPSNVGGPEAPSRLKGKRATPKRTDSSRGRQSHK